MDYEAEFTYLFLVYQRLCVSHGRCCGNDVYTKPGINLFNILRGKSLNRFVNISVQCIVLSEISLKYHL